MKPFSYTNVDLTSGYLFEKEELNRKITIDAVYSRFYETGRIGAFDFNYREGDELKPHIYWDSDVAKWMEGACYILKKHPDPALESKVSALVSKIKEHQDENGYFNIYYTVCEPENRFTDKTKHELYCAGHLMEASIAYAQATGKHDFLEAMERYADHIKKAFVDDRSAGFISPGHEEIELALVRMYTFTGKRKFLDLAEHFINARGSQDDIKNTHNQSHLPVREQQEAVGHAVRAVYLYTGMARLAAQTGDPALTQICKRLWEDVTERKMYVTGGVGSTNIGESFTRAYDLPNDTAYTETCAGIGLIYFAAAMLELENDARYADVIERVLYNGVLSGLSLDGKSFFYENPLEINLLEHIELFRGKRRFPITQRQECFECSCCPPNLNRLLSSLGNYVYGFEGDTLFVNQYISSDLRADGISARMTTEYPNKGTVTLRVDGIESIALRIPFWCESYSLNRPFTLKNGYAVVENDGGEIVLEMEIAPKAVWARPEVFRDVGRICLMRGPVVYCAEGVDNPHPLHSYQVSPDAEITEGDNASFGLPTLELMATRIHQDDAKLYSSKPPKKEVAALKLIPYNCFANRGECDMLVWLHT